MKILSISLVFVFLLSCTAFAQEKKNPLAGTTWKLTFGKWVSEDTTFTVFPKSPHHQRIIIFGKTHFGFVEQDTSRDHSLSALAKYTVDGDNVNATLKMAPIYEAIGLSFRPKFKIEGDQLIIKAVDYHFGDYKWKEAYEVWKRID